jgi:hypothetical protein
MAVEGKESRPRVVCSYNPCGNNKPNNGITYWQHRCYYITHRQDLTRRRVKYREDLVKHLKKWQDNSNKLIVCMDTNEDINQKSIGKALTDQEGLNMVEVVRSFTGQKI